MEMGIGNKVKIKVLPQCKQYYFPEFLHETTGHITDLTQNHIHIKTNSGGIYRYCIDDVTVTVLNWRNEYLLWRNQHDWNQYKTRDEIDDVLVQKLSSMLDEMENKL